MHRKHQRILDWWRIRERSERSPWDSEYEWKPLLDHDYSGIFDSDCIKYAHYLDAVMETNDFLIDDVVGKAKVSKCEGCFTALEEDVFAPKG